MQHDQFRFTLTNTERVDGPGEADQPLLRIECTKSRENLSTEFVTRVREGMDTADIEISLRYLKASTETETGVLALTDSITGEYILECYGDIEPLPEFLQTARESAYHTDGTPRYTVKIRAPNRVISRFKTDLLRVYDGTGTLIRQDSLIPSDIEL